MIDDTDADLSDEIEKIGIRVRTAGTRMDSLDRKEKLAAEVVAFSETIEQERSSSTS